MMTISGVSTVPFTLLTRLGHTLNTLLIMYDILIKQFSKEKVSLRRIEAQAQKTLHCFI